MQSVGRIGAGVLLALLAFASVGQAQSFSSLCQTAKGVCYAQGAPVGAPCVCAGSDPGRMIYAPSAPSSPVQQQMQFRLGTTCATPFGVCQIRSALPVGSPCSCYGPRGPDAGQIIAGPLGR
jgi:hypothetical protein